MQIVHYICSFKLPHDNMFVYHIWLSSTRATAKNCLYITLVLMFSCKHVVMTTIKQNLALICNESSTA